MSKRGKGGSPTSNLTRARRIKAAINDEFGLMKKGETSLVDVLRDPSQYQMRRCDIWDVLRRAPKLGEKGAKRVLLHAKVWPHDKLGDLTPSQRDDILAWLPARAR
jgi:hypothetical protein